MRYLKRIGAIALAVGLLVAAPFIYAPGAAAADEPSLEDGLHVTQRVVRTIDVPLDRFHPWFDSAPLQSILPGSTLLPRVERTEPVSGTWGQPGAIRRVHLADGSSALEAITDSRPPYYFAYKLWPEGGAGRRLVRYIQGEFHLSAIEGGRTRLEWRYSLRPRAAIGLGHLILFSSFAVNPFLETGADRIKDASEAALR